MSYRRRAARNPGHPEHPGRQADERKVVWLQKIFVVVLGALAYVLATQSTSVLEAEGTVVVSTCTRGACRLAFLAASLVALPQPATAKADAIARAMSLHAVGRLAPSRIAFMVSVSMQIGLYD